MGKGEAPEGKKADGEFVGVLLWGRPLLSLHNAPLVREHAVQLETC